MAGINYMAEAAADYVKAMKLGKKEGDIVPVLDDILKEKNITSPREIPLGIVQIPSELLVGTKTAGRSSAFSKSQIIKTFIYRCEIINTGFVISDSKE